MRYSLDRYFFYCFDKFIKKNYVRVAIAENIMSCNLLGVIKDIIKKGCSVFVFFNFRHMPNPKFLCNFLNPRLIPKKNDLAFWDSD